MNITAKTDVGTVRKQNQDSYAVGEIADGVSWAVVCDGMGGAAGGAVASTMAVRMISDNISSVITITPLIFRLTPIFSPVSHYGVFRE